MVWESVDVFGHDKLNAFVSAVDVADFKDLCVVAKDVRGHLEWRDVDYIDVWVF